MTNARSFRCSSKDALFPLDTDDPAASVRLLPDIITKKVNYSAIVTKQNYILLQKYAVKIVEYHNDLKKINSKINDELTTVALSHKRNFDDKCAIVEIELCKLNDCKSPSNFHEVWGLITNTVTELLENINRLGQSLVPIEQLRLERVQHLMQEHYISVNTTCNCNNDQLNIFYNQEIKKVNSTSILNLKYYIDLISNLKMEVVQCSTTWHYSWELLLCTWRDRLTRQNVEKINALSHHESFLLPSEIVSTHNSSKLALDKIECAMNEIFINLPSIMPITIDAAIQTFDEIDKTLSHCQTVVVKYQEHSTQIYDKKFAEIVDHIDEMRNYLTTNCVLEENNSVDAFEYSVYVICSEFEKNISESKYELKAELQHCAQENNIIFEKIKDFVFPVCNTWSEYTTKFKITCKTFIDDINCGKRNYCDKIMWLERSLDKTCSLLVECQTFKSLEKKLESAKNNLNNILDEHLKYEKDLHKILDIYECKWKKIEEKINDIILTSLGLKKIYDPNEKYSFMFNNTFYKIDNDEIDSKLSKIVVEFKISCCKIILQKLTLQKQKHVDDIGIKLEKRIKQAQEEVKIRVDLHNPRLNLITKDYFKTRKQEIEEFKFDGDKFWDEITCCEMKYTEKYMKLQFSLENIIEVHASSMIKLETEILQRKNSCDLMELKDTISQEHSKSMGFFKSAIKNFLTEVQNYKNYVENKHLSLLQHAELKKLKFSLDQKIKNEFDEFNELANEMALKATELQSNSVLIDEITYKTLSYYKHTIFCVFYLERRDEILRTCRINIKIDSAACCKDMLQFEKEINDFLFTKDSLSFITVGNRLNQFQKLYSSANKLTLMFNYSSGVELLEECVSMEKLHRRYSKFGKGNFRSLDSAFIKEILNTTKDETVVYNPNKPDNNFNWRIQRSKVIHQYVGSFKSKYGVGVKRDNSLQIKTFKQRKVVQSLSASQPSLQLTRSVMSNKKPAMSDDRHQKIVANVCAKIRSKALRNVQSKAIAMQLKENIKLPAICQIEAESPNNKLGTQVQNSKQFNMQDTFKLLKSIELLTKRESTNSCKSDGDSEGKCYDFNKTVDETMKSMLFDPVIFFGFKKRCFDAKTIIHRISSLPEKVKFHLRLATEDYIIMSEVFFRQKNIKITKTEIFKDSDQALKDMEIILQKYFDKVNNFCCDGIEKLKGLVYKLNCYQIDFISSVFKTTTRSFDCEIKISSSDFQTSFALLTSESKRELNHLINELTPSISHPKNHGKLCLLKETADNDSKKYLEKLGCVTNKMKNTLQTKYQSFLDTIESYKSSMYNIVDQTIHPEYIKSLYSDKRLIHHECLQDNKTGKDPRRLHKLFSGSKQIPSEKQHIKFYNHIAMESAHAIVHLDNIFQQEIRVVENKYADYLRYVEKWKSYWERNVKELLDDTVCT